jgi:cytochrome c peroxidase
MKHLNFLILIIFALPYMACNDDIDNDLAGITYDPVPYVQDLPPALKNIPIPVSNPLTLDGIKLGQHLFYDPILSQDSTISCSSCHNPKNAFTSGTAYATGIYDQQTGRSSMSLVNAAFYSSGMLWDGRANSIETIALATILDPIEMHNTWDDVIKKLKAHPEYPAMFRKAFGINSTEEIDSDLAAKAIAQFVRNITSGNSKYDKFREGLAIFSDEERQGMDIYFDGDLFLPDGECGHCHNAPLFTTNEYFNNGIQNAEDLDDFEDMGKGAISGLRYDNGKFRAPTLRNIVLTAPYMHDGRFNTLEEVLDHYNEGTHAAENTPEIIRDLKLTEIQKENVIKFLHTLTDTSYLDNPLVRNPYE